MLVRAWPRFRWGFAAATILGLGIVGGCGKEFEAQPEPVDGGSGSGNCIPTSCDKLGAECGLAPNGCGEAVDCGTCPEGEVCGGGGQNKCGIGSCTPTTCQASGATCGVVSDGCGATLHCGDCTPPETCGGGGVENQCGCTREECDGRCGTISDGCGSVRECGDCPSGQICGGDGPNKCGTKPCTATTCAAENKNCGTIGDGCGAALSCGDCAAPETCSGGGVPNVCGCTPKTCAALGKNCGTRPDGCGGTLSCGTCIPPQTCGGSNNPGVCGCSPSTSACGAGECGVDSDGCGGVVVCSTTCASGLVCVNSTHQCTSCVVDPCPGAGGSCIFSLQCDGQNYVSVYCPCPSGQTCNLNTSKCVSTGVQ